MVDERLVNHVTYEIKKSLSVAEHTFSPQLTLWRRNYFFNFSTSCIQNVNNTGTKQVSIMKQTAF